MNKKIEDKKKDRKMKITQLREHLKRCQDNADDIRREIKKREGKIQFRVTLGHYIHSYLAHQQGTYGAKIAGGAYWVRKKYDGVEACEIYVRFPPREPLTGLEEWTLIRGVEKYVSQDICPLVCELEKREREIPTYKIGKTVVLKLSKKIIRKWIEEQKEYLAIQNVTLDEAKEALKEVELECYRVVECERSEDVIFFIHHSRKNR